MFRIATLAALLLTATAASAEARESATDTVSDSVFLLPRVDVVGSRDHLGVIPGSASVLDAASLDRARVLHANEALRKLPGLAVRDEEGVGLRPNVGIRGLNPTRSTKLTLLEDGVPMAYAPYGDNASYYHPPVERFEQIELLKGAGQVLFGPQTIGGVINYITPTPPRRGEAVVTGSLGSRDLAVGRLHLGGRGLLLDYSHKRADGAREHTHSDLDDVNVKAQFGNALTLRLNHFSESSNVTYSGLTQAEFDRQGPRYNPFEHDRFEIRRYGGSLTHHTLLGRTAFITTNAYVSWFDRDWWRQSSTTTDTQGGPGVASARLAGDRIDVDTLRSVQGRLREYTTWGLEPRFRMEYRAGALAGELQSGLKAHFERQDRRQINGTSAFARTGTLAEDNLRRTRAFSAFASNRLTAGDWSLTPGVRYERISTERTNRLPGGATGSDALDAWIPSLGLTWGPSPGLTVFAGVHTGFAPPRAEDVIASSGTSTEVEPEASTSWEFGVRAGSRSGSDLQAAIFRNDFRRLTAVGSIAGGSTPLAQGEALFMGAEFSGTLRLPSGFSIRTAYTWVPTAEQTSPFRQVVGGAVIAGSAAGRRQPYAPEHALTATTAYRRSAFGAQLEAVVVGRQFADFANTVAASPNGQAGMIPATVIWNANLDCDLGASGVTAYVAVKNLADRLDIVDRTRGLLVSSPRTFQAGIRYGFSSGQ